jgi:electron transport complex protein RnfA
MNSIPLVLLLVYSGLTMNLILQCALGIKGVVESKKPIQASTFIKLGVVFFSVVLLWLFFSRVLYSRVSGIFIYALVFPVSYMVYDGLEYVLFRYIFKKYGDDETFICFPGGITAVAVFICLNIAGGFLEALILSFGFTAGIIFVNVIVREIRKRAALEKVPVFLRGKPLVLITMGMLSLVFSTASLLLFRMIGSR